MAHSCVRRLLSLTLKNTVTNHTLALHAAHFSHEGEIQPFGTESEERKRKRGPGFIQQTAKNVTKVMYYLGILKRHLFRYGLPFLGRRSSFTQDFENKKQTNKANIQNKTAGPKFFLKIVWVMVILHLLVNLRSNPHLWS